MAASKHTSFWTVQNEVGSVDRFLSRLRNAVIFADEEFAALARERPGDAGYRVIALPSSCAAFEIASQQELLAGKDVFLFSVPDFVSYHRVVSSAAQQFQGRYADWRYDVFPSFVGYNDSWRDSSEPLVPPRNAFVITSTARSGSTFLCDLLLENGFGNPKEHIRAPLIELVRRRQDFGLDLSRLVDALMSRCARNGWFATKIISGFYSALVAGLDSRERAEFEGKLWANPVIYLVREAKLQQAVSDFIAGVTRTWHVRGETDAETYRGRQQQVAFDFDLINQRFLAFVRAEHELQDIVAAHPNHKVVRYEDLSREPESVLRSVVEFIGGGESVNSLKMETELTRTFSEVNSTFVRLFVEEAQRRGLYKDQLGRPFFAELTL